MRSLSLFLTLAFLVFLSFSTLSTTMADQHEHWRASVANEDSWIDSSILQGNRDQGLKKTFQRLMHKFAKPVESLQRGEVVPKFGRRGIQL